MAENNISNNHSNKKSDLNKTDIYNKNSEKKTENYNKKTQNNESNSTKNAKNNQNTSKVSDKYIHKWWIDALIFIGGTLLLGGLATLLGGKMFNFQNYEMPPATAPKILFPIVWAIIYLAIGISTFLMWRDKEIKEDSRKINLILFIIHMVFNVLWPLFFFKLDLAIFSAVWLGLTVISALIVMYRYFITNIPAGIIFIIYTLWLMYAMYLNLGLVLINF